MIAGIATKDATAVIWQSPGRKQIMRSSMQRETKGAEIVRALCFDPQGPSNCSVAGLLRQISGQSLQIALPALPHTLERGMPSCHDSDKL